MHLRTDRLLLRDFEATDWQAVQKYASDPEAVRYRPFGPCTDEETSAHIAGLAQRIHPPRRTMYDLAVVLIEEDRLIGGCDLGLLEDDPSEAGLGYILNRAYWGRGYMTEACGALLGFGFDAWEIERISADVEPENAGSVRVLEKIGMRPTGSGRQWFKGRDHDVLHFAIAESEWRARRQPTTRR